VREEDEQVELGEATRPRSIAVASGTRSPLGPFPLTTSGARPKAVAGPVLKMDDARSFAPWDQGRDHHDAIAAHDALSALPHDVLIDQPRRQRSRSYRPQVACSTAKATIFNYQQGVAPEPRLRRSQNRHLSNWFSQNTVERAGHSRAPRK
jgi:hypothetical protein